MTCGCKRLDDNFSLSLPLSVSLVRACRVREFWKKNRFKYVLLKSVNARVMAVAFLPVLKCGFFLNLIHDYNFTQAVSEPIRQDNILDLFLTTNPTLITEVKCSPGLGDHDLVSAKAILKHSQHKQKPRNVLLFSKADWPKLKSKMKEYPTKFHILPFRENSRGALVRLHDYPW